MSRKSAAARTRKERPRSRRSLILSLAFGRVLMISRKKRKLSAEELSKKSGVPLSRVIGLEKGAREPTIDDLFKLATALGILPSQFMRRVATMKKVLHR